MIKVREFGKLQNGESVTAYNFVTEAGFKATILSYGATLQSLTFPNGINVVLGFDKLESYLGDHPCLGAVIGRVANRIGRANFQVDGVNYDISANEGTNSLHSGPEGFDRVNWVGEIEGDTLILRHTSPDGHQAFPGNLKTELRFRFDGHTLSLDMKATTDKATPVNLSYHPYFNLTDGGASSCEDHTLEILTEHYTPLSPTSLPTGEIASVDNTAFDFRMVRPIPQDWVLDHNFVKHQDSQNKAVKKLAKLSSITTGHKVIICATHPGLQVYTGQKAGVAIEPQNFPNAVNIPNFPDSILRPEDTYHNIIRYTFRTGEAQV